MSKTMKAIGNVCTFCAAAGIVVMGVVTVSTLIWVALI